MNGNMPARQIADGTYWLGGCMVAAGTSEPVHYHVGAFLLVGAQRSVLVDTGDPRHWAGIAESLDAILDGRPLDYLLPTHPELPHAGNLPALLDRYPDALVVGEVHDYHVHYPEHADRLRPMSPGDRLALGDREVELVRAFVYDLPNSIWAYEARSGLLCVSDGFSFIHDVPAAEAGDPEIDEPAHRTGQCRLLSSELPQPPSVAQAAYGTGRALYWTKFVDVTATFAELEAFLDTHPTRLIGPAHGNVIDEVESMLRISLAAHRCVYEASVAAD